MINLRLNVKKDIPLTSERIEHFQKLMETEGDLTKWLSDESSAQASVVKVFRYYLTIEEATQIIQQFGSENWRDNRQVLWSGMLREDAQKWADEHKMQTLTTAMGPLMMPEHPLCLKLKKHAHAWSQYVHGASAIFAWHIARGESVTLLTPPPPSRFHPSGFTYYQVIEEPIVTGAFGQDSVCHIDVVHPMIKKAEDFSYQLWPEDNESTWVQQFGLQLRSRNWRVTGQREEKLRLKNMMGLQDGPSNCPIISKLSHIRKENPKTKPVKKKAKVEKKAKAKKKVKVKDNVKAKENVKTEKEVKVKNNVKAKEKVKVKQNVKVKVKVKAEKKVKVKEAKGKKPAKVDKK
ncbi:hypothetical protein N7509_000099 [Penicillium cosmopolitanum]|uniref:Uncharacterized protein n=1 Tax=Penicillium cosmopolitanum TaxID=1131564 RepID=A0A9W9WCR4_9EURO|nr:uncharacterized protein N7509_000099 [Penicillium cosmopolitanum]KAJ5415001.1 hypothetical protein N7509_000099 [Penicillium cosmopolitanum]